MMQSYFSWQKFTQQFDGFHKTRVAGVMSGTSMDGVDVAVVEFSDSSFELLQLKSYEYPSAVINKLRQLRALGVRELAELHTQLGQAYADCVSRTQQALGQSLDLVGCHGQTVYHHSSVPGAILSTLQLGDGDQIAVNLGVPVVFDFRAKDIALGGQGAPLACYGDWIFFEALRGRAAVLNLGGIANVTFLAANLNEVTGFDTGPGNGILDRAVVRLTAGTELFDRDGQRAKCGRVDRSFVNRWLERDVFINQQPPKSTGFESYGDDLLNELVRDFGELDENLIASLTLLVAQAVALNVQRFSPFEIETLLVAGGGALNLTLMDWLREQLPGVAVELTDLVGVPIKAREAMCFAALAYDFCRAKKTSIASVTGATRAAVLGKLCIPS
jgi:anhydro-N-acetylmuramic acid kinase